MNYYIGAEKWHRCFLINNSLTQIKHWINKTLYNKAITTEGE